MDEIDYAIIHALQEDGRMSWTELGKTVGLSLPSTSESRNWRTAVSSKSTAPSSILLRLKKPSWRF